MLSPQSSTRSIKVRQPHQAGHGRRHLFEVWLVHMWLEISSRFTFVENVKIQNLGNNPMELLFFFPSGRLHWRSSEIFTIITLQSNNLTRLLCTKVQYVEYNLQRHTLSHFSIPTRSEYIHSAAKTRMAGQVHLIEHHFNPSPRVTTHVKLWPLRSLK